MTRIMRIIFLLAGIVVLGSGAPAYGQTGDCYDSKPGCLDPSFGVNGIVINQQGMTFDDVAIQQVAGESRIVVVGVISGVWAVARYRPDGSLDTTFGTNGIVKLSFPTGTSSASSVVVQPDGKLVVSGTARPQRNRYSNDTPTIARYLENGALDTSFGTNGVVSVPNEGRMGWGGAVALQADGKIAVSADYSGQGIRVIRLNSNGTLDTTFNGSGLSVNPGGFQRAGYGSSGAITIQTIGFEERIVVAGWMQRTYPYQVPTLVRFTPNGVLDTSFGGTGAVETVVPPFPGTSDGRGSYWDVQVDSNNRLVAAAGAGRELLVRYDQDGNLDTSFGTGGFAATPEVVDRRYDLSGLHAVGIQPDGTILVAGGNYYYSWNNWTTASYAANWRFTDSGALDTYFGFGGWVTTAVPDSVLTMWYKVVHMALQPDGKFVAAGYTDLNDGTRKAILLRYNGAGHPTQDVAVSSISHGPIMATLGDTVSVQVTVVNNGTSAATADVTLTESPGGNNLGTQSVSLAPGESSTLTFTWATDVSTATGDHALQATVSGASDEQSRNDSRSTTVTVVPPGVNIFLSANRYLVKNTRRVDLSWTGAFASSVDIYRNDAIITLVPNTAAYTDIIGGKGAATFVYKVCDTRSTRCSNLATVVF